MKTAMNNNSVGLTTPGPFIVSMNVIKGSPDRRMIICVVRADDLTRIIARRDLNDVAALIYYLPQ